VIASFALLHQRRIAEITPVVAAVFGASAVGVVGCELPVVVKKSKPPKKTASDLTFVCADRSRRIRRRKIARVISAGPSPQISSESEGKDEKYVIDDILVEASDFKTNTMWYLATFKGFPLTGAAWVWQSHMSIAAMTWWVSERWKRWPLLPKNVLLYREGDVIMNDEHMHLFNARGDSGENDAVPPDSNMNAAPADALCSGDCDVDQVAASCDILQENNENESEQEQEIETDVDSEAESSSSSSSSCSSSSSSSSFSSASSSSSSLCYSKSAQNANSSNSQSHSSSAPASSIEALGDGAEQFLIRDIRGHRVVQKRKQYHVFWDGYSSTEASWEPAGNVNYEARKKYLEKISKR